MVTEAAVRGPGYEKPTYKHGAFALGFVLAKRLEGVMAGAAIIDLKKLESQFSLPFDQARQNLWDAVSKRAPYKGPLSILRNLGRSAVPRGSHAASAASAQRCRCSDKQSLEGGRTVKERLTSTRRKSIGASGPKDQTIGKEVDGNSTPRSLASSTTTLTVALSNLRAALIQMPAAPRPRLLAIRRAALVVIHQLIYLPTILHDQVNTFSVLNDQCLGGFGLSLQVDAGLCQRG